jgi:hypothetical protein
MMRVSTRAECDPLVDMQHRLAAQFPTLADELIEAAVRVARAEWRTLVEDDVPELVELSAKARLQSLV